MAVRDIIVTWPKVKPLRDYLTALAQAQVNGEYINYRVGRKPTGIRLGGERPPRCYRVHDGRVQGFTEIISACHREADEVRNVDTGGYWPAGIYVVCSPVWYPVVPYPMKGFQGWRYYDYIEHMAGTSG